MRPPVGLSDASAALRADAAKAAELERWAKEPLLEEGSIRTLVLWRLYREEAETAYAFLLNRRYCCAEMTVLSKKGVRQMRSYVSYLKNALTEGDCPAFFVAHNHVSGVLTPSPHDLVLTDAMTALAEETLAGRVSFLGHYITDGFRTEKIII